MIDQRLDLFCTQHVGLFEARRAAGFLNHRNGLLAALHIAIADHDLRAFAPKRHRRRTTNSRTSARHQSDLSFKFLCHGVDLVSCQLNWQSVCEKLWRTRWSCSKTLCNVGPELRVLSRRGESGHER